MQKPKFTCDHPGCGDEVATPDNPIIYLVVGTTDNGKMTADVKLPPAVWALLKTTLSRKDYCPSCFAKEFGTELMTLPDFEATQGKKS